MTASPRTDAQALKGLTVGFDIGGTNLRAAVVDAAGRIVDSAAMASSGTASGLEDGIVRLVDELSARNRIEAVGVAIAGFLDAECETVRFAPHLPWRDAPVRRTLADRLGLPVRLEHDANSAAWGEYRFGAAKGVRDWVLFAVGTGIGTAQMHDGEIFRGAYGTAPELGHLTVVPGGRRCPCGKLGCLERYCSGTALVVSAVEIVHSHRFHGSELAEHVRRDPAAVTGEQVMAAARAGDPAGKAVVDDFSDWLGQGLSVIGDLFDPELILLGGGVSRDADLYLPESIESFESGVVGTGYRPTARVAVAELGADAGMIGVSDLARRAARP
ncbi:ROK family protein [Corynebacterium frankenforstense]|uniref:ROK family protein n=1 Tax=Corynebacterium frankenforstense TaxID=1230998 RepID=UPI00095353A6|nr:ROK family protein [Corynebacterium frankenforstense]